MESIVITALAALVGGFLLIKNYSKIERSLFGGDNPDYQPSGSGSVYVSMLLGAMCGGLFVYSQMTNANDQMVSVYTYSALSLLTLAVTVTWLITIVGQAESLSKLLTKCLFTGLCSLVAFAMGFAGTLIVLAALVLYFIAMFTKSWSEAEAAKTIRTKSGLMGEGSIEMKHYSGNLYRTSDGRMFRREGNTVTEVDPHTHD